MFFGKKNRVLGFSRSPWPGNCKFCPNLSCNIDGKTRYEVFCDGSYYHFRGNGVITYDKLEDPDDIDAIFTALTSREHFCGHLGSEKLQERVCKQVCKELRYPPRVVYWNNGLFDMRIFACLNSRLMEIDGSHYDVESNGFYIFTRVNGSKEAGKLDDRFDADDLFFNFTLCPSYPGQRAIQKRVSKT
ncbi:hypothetical protein HYALB_00001494 [Hymenoscyphus albidus]|uniref:Uncharacterized protein n=1 Tax=Hymenoscyphus albidus TaxID=595503 RepID=A0A9N9LBF7_9HELO|nr:hypothetical protein HYALB_00001494 [Hymenoscyphus albidus]